ncbi:MULTISPECIES: integrase [Pseudomonas syringae group]|uniref:Uncharacterized protein n=1 Tax=Pseudomonas caricapapayae TaxID=46678 RepID=A0A0N8QTV1_9PSED|nr:MULTISPECIES: integrase [Pseudomonas syringae group]KAA8685034.1 transposase family protein [Pseudomonas caricapapayae]KPW62614.1 hypothetical protein ALO80_200060 [Pseudomonas caricapapayae]RMM05376.1 hypothetical protein ALQ84_200052 [Pseudomonas caricapapayae]RMN72540.1 hypothetical protein ALQ55_200129 [Pseudomonas savastanoi pv. savastanoi]RMV91208.1 hypothetical protein ALP01_200479 [Pseudomonas caricapapayae]
MPRKTLPTEVLVDLSRRLATLPTRSHERRLLIASTAQAYGVSEPTLYRALAERVRPKALRRADRGVPRLLPTEEMERYCELVAAIKVRTSNKKGRHLSTGQSIRLLEVSGVSTPDGFVKLPIGTLNKTTVNRYLHQWGYDRTTLGRPPPAVRFQAEHSNDCWQFDMSPSDLKHIEAPSWLRADLKAPTLMLFSVVDDRSGTAYQEYRCVYGEDVESALRFLFRAMAIKESSDHPLQGIPKMIYQDCGPVSRSQIYQRVMRYLGVEVRTHMPAGSDGRRTTAQATGKVERPFRTVKEMHETLYHFNQPHDEAEANAWLLNFLVRYNAMNHRLEPHSRIEDWLTHLPAQGVRAMCTWERYCTFAREPQRRKVNSDARVVANGTQYEVDVELAGEEVILWWGLFDQELYIEHGDRRFGPYLPVGGPIPLHKFRTFKKSVAQTRADRIEDLARQLCVARETMQDHPELRGFSDPVHVPTQAFIDPDPFQQLTYPNQHAAKLAIADFLGTPLGRLPTEQLDTINAIVKSTLNKQDVLTQVRSFMAQPRETPHHAE